jgi:hypothetical protein
MIVLLLNKALLFSPLCFSIKYSLFFLSKFYLSKTFKSAPISFIFFFLATLAYTDFLFYFISIESNLLHCLNAPNL